MQQAHAAALRVPAPKVQVQLDFYATLTTALIARRCGRDGAALAAIEAWLSTRGQYGTAGSERENYGTLLVLAGDITRASGNWELAETRLLAADDALPPEATAARRVLAACYSKLYLELGLPDVAHAWWLTEDKLIAASPSNAIAQSDHVRSLADILIDSGRLERARAALETELSREEFYAQHPDLRAVLRYRLGIALRGSTAKGSSEDERGKGLLVASMREPALTPADRMHAAMALTHTALERDHDPAAAQTYLTEARALFDSIYPEAERARWGPDNRPPRHWGLLEAYAARIAREKGGTENRGALLARLEASFLDFLAQWRSTPMRPGGVGFLYADYRRAVLGELVHELIRQRGESGPREALERVIAAQTCGTIGRKLALAPATVDDVREKLLPAQVGALVFLPVGDELHVFALDQESLVYELVPDRAKLTRALNNRPSLTLPKDRSAAAAAKACGRLAKNGKVLADELLPPKVRARVAQWRTLLVVGGELVGGVPFESLSLDGKRLLGLDVAIEYLPSIPLGMALADRAPAPKVWKQSLAFVGAPRTSERSRTAWSSAEPFTLDDAKLRQLCDPFGKLASTCVGESATREAFLALDLADTAILHVLCHGIHDPKRERPAGLLLAETEDGLGDLWSADLELGPKIVPPIVILSACGAGRDSERLGEDALNHLGGTFLERGAICVILSREKIEL
ncbi:MAG: CHAT domain-containing protein, partial [Planctomycetes bacterium]|nr:CHAT domain-containing protein [Planctomycetota bacterium]